MFTKTVKNMKKGMFALILALAVIVSGIVMANHETNDAPAKKTVPLTAAEKTAAMKTWEATPDGIRFNNWKTSPAGQKVLTGANKIRQYINASSNMEAVVTSLSLPPGSRLGFGMMVSINGEEYILSFGPEENEAFKQLKDLKVNDKILVKSHVVSYAPKYAYPIITGDYVEKDAKILYKRAPKTDGC